MKTALKRTARPNFVYLCPGFNKFQEVGPGFVDLILPLGDGGSVRVARANQLVADSVRGGHALGANIRGISREIAEFFDEELLKRKKLF